MGVNGVTVIRSAERPQVNTATNRTECVRPRECVYVRAHTGNIKAFLTACAVSVYSTNYPQFKNYT